MRESHPSPSVVQSTRVVHRFASSRSTNDAAAASFSARELASYSDGSGSSVSSASLNHRSSSGGHSSHVAELAEVFELMDRDGDGRISCDELATLLRTIGETSGEDDDTDAAVRAMMAQADVDGDGTIDFDEFVRVNAVAAADATAAAWDPERVEAAAAEQQEELRSVFAFFDRDGDGVITADELWAVLRQLWGPADEVTQDECERIVRAADGNGDGAVDLAEFARVMHGSALLPAPMTWPQ
ncbi:hypothetical protein CLOM_g15047 [Closterium sp. NIES-68]|nr:hypothetical protein CLOM_g15047 [Closterium sp. NIES-68]GJP76232.1 hypothetical protein CLOP_g6604 [Closterium sp. NIES-67]